MTKLKWIPYTDARRRGVTVVNGRLRHVFIPVGSSRSNSVFINRRVRKSEIAGQNHTRVVSVRKFKKGMYAVKIWAKSPGFDTLTVGDARLRVLVGNRQTIKVAFRNVFNDTPGKRFDWKTSVGDATVKQTIKETEAILSWQGNFSIRKMGDVKTHTENDWTFKSARTGDQGSHFHDNLDTTADVTVFYVKDVTVAKGETGSTIGVSYGSVILIEADQAKDSTVLAHELMHFCGLPHVTGKNKHAGIPSNTDLKNNLMHEYTGRMGGRHGSNLNVYQIYHAIKSHHWKCRRRHVCGP